MVRRVVVWLPALALIAMAAPSCSSGCGLGQHDRVTSFGMAPCCGGFDLKDFPLSGRVGDPEFSLSNTAMPSKPGLVDAFLVPTSCAKLFDGPYPGSPPLCQVYIGPAAPGKATGRVKLPAGTYRVWVQAYSSNQADADFLVDVGIWDYSCRAPL